MATQLDESGSILNLYRQLLAFRKATPALHLGNYAPVDGVPDGCFVFHRTAGDSTLLVALNLTDNNQTITLDRPGTLRLTTHLDRADETVSGRLTLRPQEGMIVEV